MSNIVIQNAWENNLKHLDLEFAINTFNCVIGCSGCGKSSLVFDTIYAESQRNLLEGLTGNLYGQKLMDKPHVTNIENLRPAINISQNYYNVNPRSTVGTTTEVSNYLRALFAVVNSSAQQIVKESMFSSNNPKSFCPNCLGLGVEKVVSTDLLIPDVNKSLIDGGILFFKGAPESKEVKTLEALCDYYGIDINKKIHALTEQEMHALLYSNDNIQFKLSYKEGSRRKTHLVRLNGAVTTIMNNIRNINSTENSSIYAKYLIEDRCHVCNGAKLNEDVLRYKLAGLNYYEVESMELSELHTLFQGFNYEMLDPEKREASSQIIDIILRKINAMNNLNLGYLTLNRSMPTLSGGERQRVRIAHQLTCPLKGLLYILDEPCKGLHYRDIFNIIQATKDLVARENTVIAIEHNKRYIAAADRILELGPVGGPEGGYIVHEDLDKSSITEHYMFKQPVSYAETFQINHINFLNICDQDVSFPVGGITCVTGVSGSGKSTLIKVVKSCFDCRHSTTYGELKGGESIKRVLMVSQAPIGQTPRSSVVSYLGIFDEIRSLFASSATARKLKLSPSYFSMNTKGGRCECCQGNGLLKIDLNYLPSTYIVCPECEGRRFNEKVLSVTYNGKTILDILNTPISEVIDTFKDNKKISSVLSSMIDLGLGYLKLGQMSMNLSGGEAQRIKLAKALGSLSHGQNLYILDEPTSGLNDADILKFIKSLLELQKRKETIIIIEHNLEFIAQVADYVVDFGTQSGLKGGKIVSSGLPKIVFNDKVSSLYGLLKSEK